MPAVRTPRPLPVIANTYRCFIQQSGPGGMILGNVLHVQGAGSPTALQVAQAVGKAWAATSSIYSFQAAVTQYQSVACIPLDGTSVTVVDPFTTAAHTSGAVGGVVFPANTCAIVKLQTGLRGRSHRGRIYIGQIPTTASTDLLHLAASYISLMNTGVLGFESALVAGSPSLNLCVASYKLGTASPVTSTTVNPTLGTQRMRLH